MKNDNQNNLFLDFFTEKAATMLSDQGGGLRNNKELTFNKPSELPLMPIRENAPEKELKSYWRTLRAFFRSGKGGQMPMDVNGEYYYPALLAPFRNQPHFERKFPLWIEETSSGKSMSLHELLTDCISRFAPEENEAKILKDNLLRLEYIVREKMRFADDAYLAFPVIDDSLETLKLQLNIKGKEREEFNEQLITLRKHIPRKGLLLPFSPNLSFYLLGIVTQEQLNDRRDAFLKKIHKLTLKLKDFLAVEKEKRPEAHSADKLQSSLDFAGSYLNFEELSSVIPSGGSTAMPEERLHRIEKIVEIIEDTSTDFFQKNAFIILEKELAKSAPIDWSNTFSKSYIITAEESQTCDRALTVFDNKMQEFAKLFAAVRSAELEVENQYLQEIHGDYFAHFDWRSFTSEELAVCPPVFLFTKDNSLIENELYEFFQLLSSNRLIKFLVIKDGLKEIQKGFSFRQELGAIAIAHRNAYILQTASVAPGQLLKGFRDGINSATPSLFYIFTPTGNERSLSSSSLWTSAAVESREFPGFVYKNEGDARWGSRFNIFDNPNPEVDWPLHQLNYQNEGEEHSIELPFTFADFASQDENFQDQFLLVPPECWTEDLIPIGEYVNQSSEALYAKIPFIWFVNKHNQLHKAAVARPLVLACKERLDFWHFLQENAGIHSFHVEQATERLQKKFKEDLANKIEELEVNHLEVLNKVKEEEGRAAMERLAAVLLDLEITDLIETPSGIKEPKKKIEPKQNNVDSIPEVQIEEEEKEEEETLSMSEPWIETPLCTSCNDCINLNKRLFNYDANKQAFIADPTAGTFRELVLAAEKCPVSIIHPGAPLNADEPGLKELIERAEKFN